MWIFWYIVKSKKLDALKCEAFIKVFIYLNQNQPQTFFLKLYSERNIKTILIFIASNKILFLQN